jgi:hypothetical protein
MGIHLQYRCFGAQTSRARRQLARASGAESAIMSHSRREKHSLRGRPALKW